MAPAARLRLLYFLFYGNVGAFMPYFAPYLRGLGFSGEQIGAVQMVPALLAPAVAMSWAAYADRRGTPSTALARASAWAALAVLALPFARTPLAVGLVIFLVSLGERAVVPLVDSVTLEHCRARPGAVSYARIRLFGSIGFIALALLVGRLLTARGNQAADPLVPAVMVALIVGYALAARRLPDASPAHGARPGTGDMLALLRLRPLQLLVLTCAVHWAACAPFHLLFGVFVRDHGFPADVAGLGMAVGVAAEIAALVLFPSLERRLPLRALFLAAFLGSAVRWAALAHASTASAVILLQLLHGLTFGLFWGSAMATLAAIVPPGLRATGQALFTAVVFGLGNAAGFALSGAGYDRFGSVAPLFAWAAGVELALALVVGAVLARSAGRAR